MRKTLIAVSVIVLALLAIKPATAAANELARQLTSLGAEEFFSTTPATELISSLKSSEEERQQILPLLLRHCFVERSLIFPEGILRLREVVLKEATTVEERGLFRIVADSGPNELRLASVEWIAGQKGLISNTHARLLVTDMMRSLAADTDPRILIRATGVTLRMPDSFVAPENLFMNTLTQTLQSVQTLASDGKLTETRDLLFKLRDVVNEPRIRGALGDQKYETVTSKAFAVLWPLTTKDVVYESASWLLEGLNTKSINEVFYLRATDETKWGRFIGYDQRVILVNHPDYLRTQVRTDCESILNNWTCSFAERNGTTNHPPLLKGADSYFQRNSFLLKLAAQYGYYDLVDRAAQHDNKWYHELAQMALNAFPRKKVEANTGMNNAETTR